VALVEEVVGTPPRPPRGQEAIREIGVEERELAPLVDELRLGPEDGLGAARAHAPEAPEEAAVGVGDGVEVPCRGDDARRIAERAELAVEADELGARAVAPDAGELALALGVRPERSIATVSGVRRTRERRPWRSVASHPAATLRASAWRAACVL
jgi:hypothetical protein